jgi:hypothetical protein
MNTIRCTTLVLLAMISTLVFAQKTPPDYTFKVLVNKGKNEVKSGGGPWQPLKTGATLKAGDEVKLTENAYLGLIHKTGKPMEVKNAGTHKVDVLAAKIGQSTSVISKYTDFVLSSTEEKQNRLTATGAVHRGLHTVKIYLPKSEASFIYGNNLVLNWEKEGEGVNYVVNLKNVFGDDLVKTETTDTTMTFKLDDEKLINEDNIIIQVYPKSEPNKIPDPPYMVKKLSPADKERIKAQLNELSNVASEETALNKYFLAGFYEENKLLIDASNAYMDAIKLAPDVDTYKEDYDNFLIRHQIKDKK